jgi:ketosteroid isomerase-like protein
VSDADQEREHAVSMSDTIREGYAAYSRGDHTFVDRIFAEDIEWHAPGAEDGIHGREAVKAFFVGLMETFSEHRIRLDDAVETDGRVICFCTHSFTRGDQTTEVRSVMDWRHRDGQMVSLDEVADTLAFAVAAGMLPAEAVSKST